MTSGLAYLQSRSALLTIGSAAVALVMPGSIVAFTCFLTTALVTSVLYLASALRDHDRTSVLVQGASAAFLFIALVGATVQVLTPR